MEYRKAPQNKPHTLPTSCFIPNLAFSHFSLLQLPNRWLQFFKLIFSVYKIVALYIITILEHSQLPTDFCKAASKVGCTMDVLASSPRLLNIPCILCRAVITEPSLPGSFLFLFYTNTKYTLVIFWGENVSSLRLR